MSQPLDDLTPKNLLDEANRLLQRWTVIRLPNHDALVSSVDALRDKRIEELQVTDPLVQSLSAELASAWLYEHRLSLKPGSRRSTYICVAVSVLLMFVVASLSIVYNRGVALLAEVEALAASQPDRRFGQLERQLMVAQAQIFAPAAAAKNGVCRDDKPACAPDTSTAQTAEIQKRIDELAQEPSYLLVHELRDLNVRLTSLEVRTLQFSLDAAAPLPFVSSASAKIGAAVDYVVSSLWPKTANAGGLAPASVTGSIEMQPPKSGESSPVAGDKTLAMTVPWRKNLCEDINTSDPKTSDTEKSVLGMDMVAIKTQACRLNIDYTSITVPSVRIWATTIKDSIASYSLWILPFLYAALGSMIYFMRLILDPAQPNPEPHRIVHRTALAGLAGMALGWFWEPTFGKDTEFQAVGVGMFSFAFLVGFSIDVFYALLDRLVKLSTSAISRIGT